jgi:hypothetical protein
MDTLTELAAVLEAAQTPDSYAPARVRRARERRAVQLEARRVAWEENHRRYHPEDFDPATGEYDPFRTFSLEG